MEDIENNPDNNSDDFLNLFKKFSHSQNLLKGFILHTFSPDIEISKNQDYWSQINDLFNQACQELIPDIQDEDKKFEKMIELSVNQLRSLHNNHE